MTSDVSTPLSPPSTPFRMPVQSEELCPHRISPSLSMSWDFCALSSPSRTAASTSDFDFVQAQDPIALTHHSCHPWLTVYCLQDHPHRSKVLVSPFLKIRPAFTISERQDPHRPHCHGIHRTRNPTYPLLFDDTWHPPSHRSCKVSGRTPQLNPIPRALQTDEPALSALRSCPWIYCEMFWAQRGSSIQFAAPVAFLVRHRTPSPHL